jgi:hypothetical protein
MLVRVSIRVNALHRISLFPHVNCSGTLVVVLVGLLIDGEELLCSMWR